mmetsp:Transcript_37211/g.80936  ORF Transcript_37211/g.80936 Transcript_37211/m.80936 type:complete len:82 (+) Transcript_37211:236-481(+)
MLLCAVPPKTATAAGAPAADACLLQRPVTMSTRTNNAGRSRTKASSKSNNKSNNTNFSSSSNSNNNKSFDNRRGNSVWELR